MFRIEYFVLATAFTVGFFVAVGFGERPAPITEIPASTQGDSPLASFARFVPVNAEVLFVQRPFQTSQHKAAFALSHSISIQPSWVPTRMEQIDWIVVASSWKTIEQIRSFSTRAVFADIAGDLATNGRPEPVKKPSLSLANHFNSEFSGLIRFVNSTPLNVLADWLNDEKDSCRKYRKQQLFGREALDCGCDDCCIVVRLDNKTFLIGNKTQLQGAFQNTPPQSESPVDKWVNQLVASSFDGNLFIGSDLRDRRKSWTSILADNGPWSSMIHLESVTFQIDLQQSLLARCQLEFDKVMAAKQIHSEIKTILGEELVRMEQQMEEIEQQRANSFPIWQARQMIGLARSLRFAGTETGVTIELPRPEGFHRMMDQMFRRMTEFEAEQQAQFEAIAAELDRAKHDARMNATGLEQRTFNDIARELDADLPTKKGPGSK